MKCKNGKNGKQKEYWKICKTTRTVNGSQNMTGIGINAATLKQGFFFLLRTAKGNSFRIKTRETESFC